jgi:general stress protein YciG
LSLRDTRRSSLGTIEIATHQRARNDEIGAKGIRKDGELEIATHQRARNDEIGAKGIHKDGGNYFER